MSLREHRPSADALTDEVAIAKIAAGDLEGLGALFDRYEPDVRRVLSYLSVRSADVDDLVQLTFLQVIRAASTYDPKWSTRSWLVGIAAMMARRHRRSVVRMATRLGTWIRGARSDDSVTPDAIFDSHETEEILSAALQRMSSKRREAFVLVAIEGTPGEQAAASLGIPLSTLWTRLHHARRDLRASLTLDEP